MSCTSLNLYKNDAVVHACAVCNWQYRLIGGGGYASDSPKLVKKKLCSTVWIFMYNVVILCAIKRQILWYQRQCSVLCHCWTGLHWMAGLLWTEALHWTVGLHRMAGLHQTPLAGRTSLHSRTSVECKTSLDGRTSLDRTALDGRTWQIAKLP